MRLTNGPQALLKGGFPVSCTRSGSAHYSSRRSRPPAAAARMPGTQASQTLYSSCRAHTACHYLWRSRPTPVKASLMMAIERSALGPSDLTWCAKRRKCHVRCQFGDQVDLRAAGRSDSPRPARRDTLMKACPPGGAPLVSAHTAYLTRPAGSPACAPRRLHPRSGGRPNVARHGAILNLGEETAWLRVGPIDDGRGMVSWRHGSRRRDRRASKLGSSVGRDDG